ncbi:MAG: Nif11-like leader peptide family natural product precursor [Prochloraceae cyanobacterium]|nr:Nif11-like leader peptide family natural product precursor [Prochloraceae cyanobacterium]
MSTESAKQFLDKAGEDEQLAQEIAKAMEAENDRQAVTELAATKGYQFTSDELWAEIQNRQNELQQRQDSGELSEEELEAVAGGGWSAIITATVNATIQATKQAKW